MFGEDLTSAEVSAGSPAEKNRKDDKESSPSTSLEDGVSSSARHGVLAQSEPVNAPEDVESSGNEVAAALIATTGTGEPDSHNDNPTDGTDQSQQQAFLEPISNNDPQILQEPESPSLPAKPSRENEDTIDYDEEDNVDQEASVGSSTLQGDVSEAAVEEAQLHCSRSIYTADSNHGSAAEELPEEKPEIPYSADEQLSAVGDVYQRDHSIAYANEKHVGDDGTFDAQDGAPVELTESGKDQSARRQESQDAEEDEEQLEYIQSLQHANHDLLHTTNQEELTDHQHPTPSISNLDQAFDLANTDQFTIADGDEVAGQDSLYHHQHFQEEASEDYTAEQLIEEEASEDEIVHTHDNSVVNPDSPTVRSGDGSHNLPEPATDVDEITYEEDEIEEATDRDVTRTDANASPKSSVRSATLKRVRSPPDEGNVIETDFLGKASFRCHCSKTELTLLCLVDPKRVRSG